MIRHLKIAAASVLCLALASGCEYFQKPPPETKSETMRSVLTRAAVSSSGSRDYGAALGYYRTLYQRDSHDMESLLGYAAHLRYMGALAQAKEILDKSLEWATTDPRPLVELGKVHLADSQPEQALAALGRAKALGTTDWRAYSAEGIAYDLMGRYDEARASYAKALEQSPNNPAVLNNLALSHAMSGDLASGIGVLTSVSSTGKANVQIRQNLALLYSLNGDFELAEPLTRDLPKDMVARNLEYLRQLTPKTPHPAPTTTEN